MPDEAEVEVDLIPCAECGVPIETRWLKNRGLLPGDYVLIADWVFHPGCWDAKVDRHMTESEQRVMKRALLRSTRLIERG